MKNILFVFLFTLTACFPLYSESFGTPKISSDEFVWEMGFDEASFGALPLCEQVKLYAYVGSFYLNRGHRVAVVPRWMHQALDSQPRDQLVDCLVSEGHSQLQFLSSNPEQYRRASYAIHALLYKAFHLRLFDDPHIEAFAYEVGCKSTTLWRDTLVYPFLQEGDAYPSYSGLLRTVCSGDG